MGGQRESKKKTLKGCWRARRDNTNTSRSSFSIIVTKIDDDNLTILK